MKRIICVLTTILLLAAVMTMSVFATTGGAAASEVAGQVGKNVEILVSVQGYEDVTSMSVSYKVPSGLRFVSAQWIPTGRLANVDTQKQRAVWTSDTSVNMSAKTDVFKLVFQVLEPAVGQTDLVEEVEVNVTVISGADQRTDLTAVGKVTVSYPATAVTLNKSQVTLDLAGNPTEQLTAAMAPVNTTDTLRWESSDNTVVTVDETGKITGLKYGTAVITAYAGNASAQCQVTVDCGHTGNLQKFPANPASCEKTGNNLYYLCGICNQYVDADKKVTTVADQTLPKKAHEPVHHEAVTANCGAGGNVEYWSCDGCQKNYADNLCTLVLTKVDTPVDPHNHVGETEVKNAAANSCYQDGYTGDTYCKTCNQIAVPGAPIGATNAHVADTVWHTDGKYHWHVCTTVGCGKELDKVEHTFQWKEDKPATEYETGLKHEECSCGAKANEGTVIPKKPHVHKDITHHNAVPGTCVKAGNVEYWTCGSDLCDGKYYADANCQQVLETIVDPIDPDNHVGETEIKNAAANSCYQDGYTGDTYCVSCGEKVLAGEVIYATNDHVADTAWHTDGTSHWHVCTTAGCGKELEKAEHRFQWKTDKEATEYETGLKHEECACGVKRSEDTVIPKLDHVHKDIKHYAANPATCVKEGTVEYWTCGSDLCAGKYYGDEKCQLELSTIVDPVNTANHTGDKEVKNKVKATCGTAGYTGDTYCGGCGALLKEGKKTSATGKHTPKTGYKTDGDKHWQVCSQCNAVVDATKHTLEWIVDQEPTEETEGKKHQKCSVCGYVCSENTVMGKLEHAPALVTGREPTCTEDGVAEHFLCPTCGRYYASDNGSIGEEITADKLVLKATGHSYSAEWSSDGKHHWHACDCGAIADKAEHSQTLVGALEATDKTPGYTGDSVCSVCGHLIAAGQEIPCEDNANVGVVILVVGLVLAGGAAAVAAVLIIKKKR